MTRLRDGLVTPVAVRWAGAAGSVLLGVSAYLGGSGYTRGSLTTLLELLHGEQGLLLPVCWFTGLTLLLIAWWVGVRCVPSTRWALVTAGLWLLPLLPMLPLGSEDIYSYACQGFSQHSGADPYATGVGAVGCPWLSSVSTTWRDSPAPYGPLFLLLAGWAVAVGGSLAGVIAGLRVIALAGLALVAAGLPVLARRTGVDPAQATWTVLACPLVGIHLVSGAHNDALMVGLLVAGLAVVASRQTPAALLTAGVLLGGAATVKVTAVVVLPFVVLAAVAVGCPLRALWRPAAWLAAGAAAAVGVVSVVAGRGFGWTAGLLRSGDTVEWTSPSTAVGMAVQWGAGLFGARVAVVPATRALGVLVLVVVLVVLWWRARGGDALRSAGYALAATVLCAPVLHPWYATWPLAVLAATRARSWWVWGAGALAATLTLPDGYNWAMNTRVPGALLVTVALVVLAVWALRRAVWALRRASSTTSSDRAQQR